MKKKNILITGATSEIGQVVCDLISARYPEVRFVTISRSKPSYKDFPYDFDFIPCDLGCQIDLDQLESRLADLGEAYEGFIHLAGTWSDEMPGSREFTRTFNVNTFSAWRIAKILMDNDWVTKGGIVFAGSVGHKFGGKAHIIDYAASKSLLEYFPRFFREYVKKRRVTVNTVQIGVVAETSISLNMGEAEITNRILKIPTGVAVKKNSIAELIFWLVFINDSVNLQTIPITEGE